MTAERSRVEFGVKADLRCAVFERPLWAVRDDLQKGREAPIRRGRWTPVVYRILFLTRPCLLSRYFSLWGFQIPGFLDAPAQKV